MVVLSFFKFFMVLFIYQSGYLLLQKIWRKRFNSCTYNSVLEHTSRNLWILLCLSLAYWRNTSAIISWFKDLPNKSACRFVTFDVAEFYPSIAQDLSLKAISFAKGYTTIEPETIDLILHSRKSLLFYSSSTWIKKDGNLFDVTMGSYEGAEICELVGLFLLHKSNTLMTGKARSIGLS